MTNIVLLVKDRPRLTQQTLDTLYTSTPQDQFNVLIVNDGSTPETVAVLNRYANKYPSNLDILTFLYPIRIVGFLKNIGAWAAERFFGRGEWLYFSDNDIAFMPHWLERMIQAKEEIKINDAQDKGYAVLGGYRHPFHGVKQTSFLEGEFRGALNLRIEETDAVAGYSMLMRWATWDLYGPFDATATGVCQSEDYAFCQKIVANRGHVGYVWPPVMYNCGLTNSEGKPAIGHAEFERRSGLVYE